MPSFTARAAPSTLSAFKQTRCLYSNLSSGALSSERFHPSPRPSPRRASTRSPSPPPRPPRRTRRTRKESSAAGAQRYQATADNPIKISNNDDDDAANKDNEDDNNKDDNV
jgi:hypothetical protein